MLKGWKIMILKWEVPTDQIKVQLWAKAIILILLCLNKVFNNGQIRWVKWQDKLTHNIR